ncbi:MAG: hypothetical protein QXM38_01300 [Candidatus Aenigmatarchaeota archaeon]
MTIASNIKASNDDAMLDVNKEKVSIKASDIYSVDATMLTNSLGDDTIGEMKTKDNPSENIGNSEKLPSSEKFGLNDEEAEQAKKVVKDVFSLYGNPEKVPYQEIKQSLNQRQIEFLLENGVIFLDSEKRFFRKADV